MHLAAFADLTDIAIVRDERVPSRPPRRPCELESTRDDGAQAVGADDEIGHNLVTVRHPHATHPARCVACHIDDARIFTHGRAGIARGGEHNGVEYFAAHRQTAVAKSLHAASRELADDSRTVWRANHHASQLRGTGSLDRVEHAHVRENARCLRTQILRAWLGSREARTIEHRHRHAAPREREGERATCGTAPDNHDLCSRG